MSEKMRGIGLTVLAGLVASALMSLVPAAAWAQTYSGVLTWHNDNQRTGQYLNETILTPQNVNKKQFGKLFTYAVDGQIYAQPLYVSSVPIPGQGLHNVVYVATENDSVYAFDADGLSATPLWQDSFIDPANGVTPVPCTDTGNGGCTGISPQFGITGTPVIDGTSGTLYAVAFTKENGTYVYRIHALDITSGAEKFGGPVVIQASVPGTGSGSIGGMITFDPLNQCQRTALLLSQSVVYMGWGTVSSVPWHGWIMGYDAQTLAQATVYNDTANGKNGGIWASGNGFAADANGNIYTVTADGTFDGNTGGIDYGDSFLKLGATGGLSVDDYFTPYNQLYLTEHDLDLGSGGPMILPAQPGPYPDELIGAGKQGLIYLVNRDNMGGYSSTTNNNIQTVTTTTSGFWSSPAYWRGAVYYSGVKGYLSRYTLTSGLLSTTPASQAPMAFTYPGSTPSISANVASNGIVWAISTGGRPSGGPPAILHAYVAANVSHVLYGSNQAGTRDQPGPGVKFSVATIANGKVYIGTQTDLDIYGLLP
ncbi:MAG: pyrrolo-quinoline quinone [Terriglobia bacterium]